LNRPASARELFWVTSKLALRGFGGVLPLAHRVYVEEQQWLDEKEFAELIALAQVMPGPNVVNLSIAMGDRYFGLRGVIASLGGMMCFPLITITLLSLAYSHAGQSRWFRAALDGMAPVAAGLIIAMAVKLAITLFKHQGTRAGIAWSIMSVASIVALVFFQWPITWVVLLAAPLGWMIAFLRLRKVAK
jgi:chromate transporter